MAEQPKKPADDKIVTLYHPTALSLVSGESEPASQEVPAKDVDDWKAAGWRVTEPDVS